MTNKERFIEIYRANIHREGADKLLEYLESPQCDFFEAPASARFHSSYPGGLLDHSLNVYDCLVDYLSNPPGEQLQHQQRGPGRGSAVYRKPGTDSGRI